MGISGLFVRAFPRGALIAAAAVVACALLCGCGVGLIYTHTVEPLDVNCDKTPYAARSEKGGIKQIQYSLVDVRWDSNAIGDIAKREGLKEVYFADLETLRVLVIFTEKTVHIYGR